MDHRQLQVGVRVVDRDPPRLGDNHDQERPEGEQRPDAQTAPHHRRERGRTGGKRHRKQDQQQRRFDERREGDLAAGPHPAEIAPRIERGQRQGEPRQGE